MYTIRKFRFTRSMRTIRGIAAWEVVRPEDGFLAPELPGGGQKMSEQAYEGLGWLDFVVLLIALPGAIS